MPLISICIPAYKRLNFLERLLDSIVIQDFKDFEVIITDDSPNDIVEKMCKKYGEHFILSYHRNLPALGTPANWNFAISKAQGKWIKIMHDDDWFSNSESLRKFAHETQKVGDCSFFFCGYTSNDQESSFQNIHIIKPHEEILLKRSPLNLFKKNFIGHPSTTLIRNHSNLLYDEQTKWVVDFEFYIRCLNEFKFFNAIKEPLVNIGISDSQVTKTAFRNPSIEIPENIYLLNKLGVKILNNILVYDYYWRFVRNMTFRDVQTFQKYLKTALPVPVVRIINFQNKFPWKLLKVGFISKSLMTISYMGNYIKRSHMGSI